MIKHVIIWKLKEEYSFAEKESIKANAKLNLESLVGKIRGLTALNVRVSGLLSSSADMMLDSTFDSFDALREYKKAPEHVKVADTFVRPFVEIRLCFDYELKE